MPAPLGNHRSGGLGCAFSLLRHQFVLGWCRQPEQDLGRSSQRDLGSVSHDSVVATSYRHTHFRGLTVSSGIGTAPIRSADFGRERLRPARLDSSSDRHFV